MTILSEVNTLAKAAKALSSGALTSVQLTEACLERCTFLEPRLSAFVTLAADEALAMARKADARRMNGGDIAPVSGVPLSFKDIIDVAGLSATGHSRLYRDRIASVDAVAVARLRAKGAVFLGKVATNEFAIGAHDETALAPNACNPWNRKHTPGGSSSGSAVSVAAHEAFGALGTDTGGSIRVPAAFNGIVGMMPSRGLVSRRGVMPLSESMDNVGPMARSVEDAALLLDAIVSPEDDAARQIALSVESFHAASSSLPKDVRFLRLRDFDERLSEVQCAVLDQAETLMKALGFAEIPAAFDHVDELDAISAVIATSESWSYHRARLAAHPDLYGRDARLKLHIGALISADDYLLAKRRQSALIADFEALIGPDDFLMLPTTLGPAPLLVDRDGKTNFGHWSHIGPNGFANVLRGPAIALPCGMENGLPLSIQLVGRHGSDATLLAVARALENAVACSELALPRLGLS